MRVQNEDRIRTWEACPECKREFFGCFAKRLGEYEVPSGDGTESRQWWGPVGEWWYTEREPT